jgi:hypothetical protein
MNEHVSQHDYSRNLLRSPTNPIMKTLPTLPGRIVRAIHMLFHIRRPQPLTAILLKRLDPRLELGFLKFVIVDRSNARDTGTRVSTAATVHEGATDAAKAVFHVVASCNRFLLTEAREFVFAADMFHMGVFDDEIGSEHAVRQSVEVTWSEQE